jgi:DHA1 family bicyclomycin/chloramphenicol resistance-like MFS transporter
MYAQKSSARHRPSDDRSRHRLGSLMRRAPLFLLAVVSAIAPASLHLLVPALPLLAVIFRSPPGSVQLVLTLFLVGVAAGQLVYGPISDRFGRRPVLIAGLALYLVGTALGGLALSLPALIVGRVLQALGGSSGMVLGRAIVRDLYDRERSASALAIVSMTMSLAPSIAPAIGGYLAVWAGWRADFVLLGVIGTAGLVLTAARLEETHLTRAPVDVAAMAGSFMLLLRSPAFLGYALAASFTSASWFTFTASAPYLLTQLLHAPLSTYGLMILLPMGAYMLGAALLARLTMRFGSTAFFVAGLALSLASGAMMAAWSWGLGLSAWSMFVPMALSSIGNGLSQPPALAAGLSVYPRIAGAASGLMGFLQMMIAASGTFLVALLPQNTGAWMILLVSAFMLLAFVCGLLALRLPAAAARTAPAPEAATGS